MDKLNQEEINNCNIEYLVRLIKKYIYKKRKTEENRNYVLKFINEYNETKNQELKVENIASENITLQKSNVLPSISEGYMQDLLKDLLKENKYKKMNQKR